MIRHALPILTLLAAPAWGQGADPLAGLAEDIDRELAAARAARAAAIEAPSPPAEVAPAPAPAPGRVVTTPLDAEPLDLSPIFGDRRARPPILILAPEEAVGPAPATSAVPPTPEAIEAARFEGADLPRGPSALTVKVQVLLDRAGVSPGVIDGEAGGMSTSALAAFEARAGLPVDGALDAAAWAALGGDRAAPILATHVVGPEDLAGLAGELPTDYAELALLPSLAHERATERLAERFHMAEGFLIELNPGASFAEGEAILVADPGVPTTGVEVARIVVRKSTGRLSAYDARGLLAADYPVTVGSADTPSPSGVVEVVAVAIDPTYHYDPANFVQGENLAPLTLPPGPNGPVGSVWIDLSRPSYGLHGTPEPASLFRAASHGCVRLTNWDAEELARLVRPGTVVEFVE